MARPRHPDKDLEKLMQEAETCGWAFTKRRYFNGRCGCPLKHTKTVHLTPHVNYGKRLRAWFQQVR